MGMFDNVIVADDIELEGFPCEVPRRFQTKSMDCVLDVYHIKEGALHKEVRLNFSGTMVFYTFINTHDSANCECGGDEICSFEWFAYTAEFKDGNLISIDRDNLFISDR